MGGEAKFDLLDGQDHFGTCDNAFTTERLDWMFGHSRGDNSGIVTLEGDLNGDGFVNTGDVSELYKAILAGYTDAMYDVNGDGSINTGDVSAIYKIILGN